MDHDIEVEEQKDDVVFVQDVDNKVFQAIVVKTLMNIDGVRLLEEGSLIDDLLGREGLSRVKGVYIEQDLKNHMVSIKIELQLAYGLSLQKVAKEIKQAVVQDVEEFTGFNIGSIHLVFKHLYEDRPQKLEPKSHEMDEMDEVDEIESES